MMPFPVACASWLIDLPSKCLFSARTAFLTKILSYQSRASALLGSWPIHSTTSLCNLRRISGSLYARSLSSSDANRIGCHVGTPRNSCALCIVNWKELLFELEVGLARIPACAASSAAAHTFFHSSGCRGAFMRLL